MSPRGARVRASLDVIAASQRLCDGGHKSMLLFFRRFVLAWASPPPRFDRAIQMTSSSVLLKCANILLLGANPRLRLLVAKLEDRLSYAALGRRKTAEISRGDKAYSKAPMHGRRIFFAARTTLHER